MEEADAELNLRSVSLCTAGKAQEAEAPLPTGEPGGADGGRRFSPGQSAVSLKARFLQQPRHRLNTHLLPWTQKSL